MAEPPRRLPVYLMLDCSGGMSGEPIELVRQGVRASLAKLRDDPMALDTVYLSVITYAGSAVETCPLTELNAFQEPNITSGGSRALGAALRLLEQCVDREVRPNDFRPLVLLLSDGQPTDHWESAADSIRAKRLNMIALAAGDAAVDVLERITDKVVELRDFRPARVQALFDKFCDCLAPLYLGDEPGVDYLERARSELEHVAAMRMG